MESFFNSILHKDKCMNKRSIFAGAPESLDTPITISFTRCCVTRVLHSSEHELSEDDQVNDTAYVAPSMYSEKLATEMLLGTLAGEIGLALESWCVEPRTISPRRSSGLALDGYRDYTVAGGIIGHPIGPAVDHAISEIYQWMPRAFRSKIANFDDLIGMDLFDFWVGPGSRHETIFVDYDRGYRAIFFPKRIDWRLGFGLPDQHDALMRLHWYSRDASFDGWFGKQIESWSSRLRELTPSLVDHVLDYFPHHWISTHWERLVRQWIDQCDVDAAAAKLRHNLSLYNQFGDAELSDFPVQCI